MREAQFLKRNAPRWREFERKLNGEEKAKPDDLADLFIQVSDDLSYARTHYPESNTPRYLNGIALRVHQAIFQNKREKLSRFIIFWKYEVPLAIYQSRLTILFAFLIFLLGALMGALSAAKDLDFARLILGNGYVNMTLNNIENGDPMGVYGNANRMDMFFYITYNNIRVSFFAFISGIIWGLGSVGILFRNAMMLGVFQYFFIERGLFLTSFLAVWIHGTLEIWSIIVAGASGMVMGAGLLFPGTYTRMESFKNNVRKALKLLCGLIPLFIIAGFLESFITRLYKHQWIGASVITLSTLFIIWYFIIYPYYINKLIYGKKA